jgi:hypothetical protein
MKFPQKGTKGMKFPQKGTKGMKGIRELITT